MSIYATLTDFILEDPWTGRRHVFVQGVPGHIGHPDHYPDGDPYGSFLPPPIDDEDGLRAVVVICADDAKGTERGGQEYVDPLLVMTGDEYACTTFDSMMSRIDVALQERYGKAEGIREATMGILEEIDELRGECERLRSVLAAAKAADVEGDEE